MKRIYRYITPFALALGLLGSLSACRKDVVDGVPVEGAYPIGFDQVATKALITDNNLTGFKVWGETAAGAADVFKGVVVTKGYDINANTIWTYPAADTQYWEENTTYNFFAVAPTPEDSDVTYSDGMFSVAYEMATDIDAANDLVVADRKVTTGTITEQPDPVQMNFSHVLTKVNVKLLKDKLNESQDIVVNAYQIAGMYGSGSYVFSFADDFTPHWQVDRSGVQSYVVKMGLSKELDFVDNEGALMSEDGFVFIPQELSEGQLTLYVQYWYTDNDKTDQRLLSATIPVDQVNKWEPNAQITYTAVISVDNTIKFGKPEVESWGAEQVGGTIIIK